MVHAAASLKFRRAAALGNLQRGTRGSPGAVQALFLAGGAVDLTPHVPSFAIIHIESCKEFSVNEEWLLHGSMPMFVTPETFSLDNERL